MILISPQHLLRVRFTTDGIQEYTVTAAWCRYVVGVVNGQRVIAIEIAYDPSSSAPQAAYFSAAENLQRHTVPPSWVLGIAPYLLQ